MLQFLYFFILFSQLSFVIFLSQFSRYALLLTLSTRSLTYFTSSVHGYLCFITLPSQFNFYSNYMPNAALHEEECTLWATTHPPQDFKHSLPALAYKKNKIRLVGKASLSKWSWFSIFPLFFKQLREVLYRKFYSFFSIFFLFFLLHWDMKSFFCSWDTPIFLPLD